jgi:hypothetical protein
MNKCCFHLLVISAGALLLTGCGESDTDSTASAGPVVAPPVAVNVTQPKAGAVAPPPVSATSVAGPPGAGAAATVSPDGPLQNLVNKGNIFFYDEDENFLAKDGVDFLQRAIRSYLDTQKYTSDDSNELPALTDLSMLVQYKVVKALPSPPPGQKFVLDPQSRKVSLVSN